MSLDKFAIYEGKIMFRLIVNRKDNTFDVENGMMEKLNKTPLLTHDESMAFIHQYSIDKGITSMAYTTIER